MNDLEVKATRADILKLEETIKQMPGALIGDNSACPLTHSFADGMYVREIFIPKGMLLVGKIHKKSNPVFVMSGDISIFSEEGTKRFKAPCYLISQPGAKRVGYAHEDTVWVEVLATNETDLDKIEEEVIASSYEQLTLGGDVLSLS
jgi:hypothetical protein